MVSRRKFCTILSGAFSVAAAPVYSNTPGLLRNVGDIRVIKLKNNKTSEKINPDIGSGTYISEALKEVNYL